MFKFMKKTLPITSICYSKLLYILRGLYTYFLYITKLRYMKEEVETFQKIYIKVYGVNWSSPPKKIWKGGYFQVIWNKFSFGSKNWAIYTCLVSKWTPGQGIIIERQYVPKNWLFATGGCKIWKNGEQNYFW